ncbi:MAG: OmpH family outer membrane protein [Prevotella sp.]|nr:OmpH family outer membrane protein [Prevotella sp.]MCM1075334.1 OmpH family outer membrane protein [Ruminococcus sp.]
MKKLINALCIALLTVGGLGFTSSCNSGNTKEDSASSKVKTTKTSAKPSAKSTNAAAGNLPNYRYVDTDTLIAKYNLAKDYDEEMLRQQNSYENTVRQRESSIQSQAAKYEQQYKNNQMDESAYMKAMQDMQNRQVSAQKEIAQLQQKAQLFEIEARKVVNDSIMNFIKEYNKTYGYDAIFMKAATLYIDPALDITDEVLEGLNARYNKQ